MMFQMLLRLLAVTECVYRNVNSSPLQVEKNWIERGVERMKSTPETLEELANRDPVAYGDELVDRERNAVDSLWTQVDAGGRVLVPYVISPSLTSRAHVIRAAMDMISEKTCVTFRPRVAERDYLNFKRHHGCASYVGCIGGPQTLYVGPYCHKGNVCHEILHALGFHHEQTRPDHDNYITIIYDNIIDGKQKNFYEIHGNMLGTPYDPSSIMHYGSRYFSANGSPTIVDKSGSGYMGQRRFMTEGDNEKVNKLYKCDTKNN